MRLSLAQKVTLPLLGFGAQGDALEYLKSLGDWAALWDLQDASGLVALAYNNEIPVGRDWLLNPGFESWASGIDVDDWIEVGDVSQEAVIVHDGSFSVKFNVVASANVQIRQTLTGMRQNNTVSGGYWIKSSVAGKRASVTIGSTGSLGVSSGSTDWEFISYTNTLDSDDPLLTITRFDGGDYILYIDTTNLKQTGILDNRDYPGAEVLTNNDFGTGDFTGWTTTGATSTFEIVDGRAHVVGNDAYTALRQDPTVVLGADYQIVTILEVVAGSVTVAFSDSTGSPNYYTASFGVGTHNINVQSVAVSVDTSATFQCFTNASGEFYVISASLREANPLNGDNDGATVNQPLQPGIVAYSFDSVNDEVVVLSVELNSGITPLAGTMVALFKIGTAVWEDSTIRTLFRIYVDATNYITMKKGANVGEVIASYAGEGAAAVDIAHLTLSPLGTMSMIITFDIAANEFKMYLQGTQHGATGAITAVMLGNITSAVIGSTGAGEYWDELAAHVGFMRRLMTATEIATYTGMLNLESGTAFDAGFDEGFI